MCFYDARETKNLPSQKQRPVTWRPRVDLDSMNRDGGRQQSLCFSPGQINSRWPPPPPPPCRTKLIRKWRSRFSVSIALRQMEMASFHHFRISVSPSALSLSRGSPTHVHSRGRTTKLRNRFIPSKTPRRHWSNPFLNVFLSDRRKSRRFLVGSREIKGEKGRSWEGKVFGNWFSSVGLGDCFGFKEEMYFWEEVF